MKMYLHKSFHENIHIFILYNFEKYLLQIHCCCSARTVRSPLLLLCQEGQVSTAAALPGRTGLHCCCSTRKDRSPLLLLCQEGQVSTAAALPGGTGSRTKYKKYHITVAFCHKTLR